MSCSSPSLWAGMKLGSIDPTLVGSSFPVRSGPASTVGNTAEKRLASHIVIPRYAYDLQPGANALQRILNRVRYVASVFTKCVVAALLVV